MGQNRVESAGDRVESDAHVRSMLAESERNNEHVYQGRCIFALE